MTVAIVNDVGALRETIAGWRVSGQRVALVPTMGALHAGHVSLVEAARDRADRVVATIFVNPKQFAPGEDFAAYPRDLAADHARVAAAGADLVYAPDLPAMYPEGFCTSVSLGGPALAGLEDRFRPDHFAGVATVVTKLLLQALSDVALFGEKDWQQLKVIERLVRDLDVPVAVHGRPTVREADGLAMSSRNAYLDPVERARAPALHRALSACAAAIARGEPREPALAAARSAVEAGGFALDYLELRAANSLAPLADGATGTARLLVAARLGRTRLIDNVGIALPPSLPQRLNTTGSPRV